MSLGGAVAPLPGFVPMVSSPDMRIAPRQRRALGAGREDGRERRRGRLGALPGLDVQGCGFKGQLVGNRWSYAVFRFLFSRKTTSRTPASTRWVP